MGFFNYYGVAIFVLLMIPNIIYAVKVKKVNIKIVDKVTNKSVQLLENVGRYGVFASLIFNIPKLYYGFWFDNGEITYIVVAAPLLLLYFLFWMIKTNSLVKALTLSIIPSVIFLFCGVMILSIPLILFAILFALFHIYISVKNA